MRGVRDACGCAPLRQVRVLQAVDGEAAARVGVARLEVGDDAVVDVLLLLAEEVGADRVERVGRQLVVALEHLGMWEKEVG